MSSILKLKDQKYFTRVLGAFSKKSHITFEIESNAMKISSVDAPFIHLAFEDDIFEIDNACEFTIRVDELINNMSILPTSLVRLNSSFKLLYFEGCESISIDNYKIQAVEQTCTYIEIPFTNPIKSNYVHRKSFSTKLLVQKEALKFFIRGNVTYQCTRNTLVIIRNTTEMCEKFETSVDFLESGYLDFHCSNEWVEHTLRFQDFFTSVMMCFSDDLLCVKFILKDYHSAYLEIQTRAIHRGDY